MKSLCLLLATAVLTTTPGAAACLSEYESQADKDSAPASLSVPVPCLEDIVRALREDLDGLGPDVHYTLVSGAWSRAAITDPSSAASSEIAAQVDLAASFTTTPLVSTRIQRAQIVGPPECNYSLHQGKLAATPSGFTFVIGGPESCRMLSAAGEWIAFQVEPASALARLDPKWLYSHQPLAEP